MGKRLSANAPKPRTRFPFPGYPTVAAAGLYLCLSGGCSGAPGLTNPANVGGAGTGGTTSTGGATSTGGSTSIVNTTDTGGNLAGGVSLPFEETPTPTPDAGTPDVLPPTPDAEAPDVMEPPPTEDASGADLVPTEPQLPPLGGAAPGPY
jgi:hypothetical protein